MLPTQNSLVEPAPRLLCHEELVVEFGVVRHKDDASVAPPFRLFLGRDIRQPRRELLPDFPERPRFVGDQNLVRDSRHACASK